MNKKTKHRILKGLQKQVNKKNIETVSIIEIIITRSDFRSNSKENTQKVGSGRLKTSLLYESPV
jgi:hypothetical protein